MVAVAAVALWLSGCVSGHMLALARRREYAREIHTVVPTDTGTVVAYTAEVVDDEGTPVGTVQRTVRLDGRRDRVEVRDLTRIRTAPWLYPMLPITLALDVIVTPTVVLTSPPLFLVAD